MFRAANYPLGGVDPTNRNRVVVTFGSYINRDSNESPRLHTDRVRRRRPQHLHRGENRWLQQRHPLQRLHQPAARRSPAPPSTRGSCRSSPTPTKQASTDQYWQGAAFAADGTLVASYYDRSYGTDNTTGYSDITVSASHDQVTFRPQARHVVVDAAADPVHRAVHAATTSASTSTATTAYPIWADTRTVDEFLCPGTGTPSVPPTVCTGSAPNAPVANDEDIFAAAVAIP